MMNIVRLEIADEHRALPGSFAKLVFYNLDGDQLSPEIRTADANGRIEFGYEADLILAEAIVYGGPGLWTMRYTEGDLRGKPRARLECLPLPEDGPIGWWHQALGVDAYDQAGGSGIKVGVVDTGMVPHQDLRHVNCIGTIFGGRMTGDTGDDAGHGTHVAGLIAGRPVGTGYAGIAPGAEVVVVRACGQEAEFRSQDITRAIGVLVDEQVDIINLSLGSPTASLALREAIQDAFDRGVLCVAAAGNESGPVQAPACFTEVMSVAAYGKSDWGPSKSHARACQPLNPEPVLWNGLFRPEFNAYGEGLDLVAPGVGIISAIPDGTPESTSYSAMTGSSMAAPLATGALAVLLAKDETYLNLPRDGSRAKRARTILNASLRDLDLPKELQGGGIPNLHAVGSP